MTDTITKIYPSDLISDSMVKINRNFEIISNRDDVTESKLNQWVENIENQLADIRNDNGIISDTLLNNVQKLENKINNITNLDGITKEVQNIINNATTDVENLINDKAGEAISSRLGDYVKTSTLNKTLGEYVSSTAFDTYRSDSSKSSAQSSRIVANSKFLKLDNDGVECLVRISGEITEFKSVEDYFKSLSASEKAAILGDKTFSSDDKALEDPDVITKLIEVCERTFKTVISEMSVISQTVGPGNVENTIISTVKNGKTGKDITASIFTKANEKGSLIALNADHINIEGEHALTVKSGGNIGVQSGGNINIENGGNFKIKTGGNISVQSGGNISIQSGGNFTINSGGKFQITSTNFNINSDGTVNVTGAIKATSLEIKGSDNNMIDISDETKLSNFVKTHQDTVSGGSSYDDKWLKDALNGGTTIDGGLVLSNAILTKDSNDNITAGMIGSNSTENDIRFFAGTNAEMQDMSKAPFRVYEDGKFEATKGKFGCLEIGVAEWMDLKGAMLEGTTYEEGRHYFSPDEISELEPDQYYTHYIQMSPEIFLIDAHIGDVPHKKEYESVRILPLGNPDTWGGPSGLVEIYARSDEYAAIYVGQGTIESDHFRGRKKIKTSESESYIPSYPVETVMSNLCGLNIAFIVSDKTQFKFKFTKDSDYEGNVIYDLDIYLNDMKILTDGTGHFESSLTEVQKNSISVNTNISNDKGVWRYKNTNDDYVNLVGCYTTSFNKALQPSTLFITLGNQSSNGSIYLGNLKIVG